MLKFNVENVIEVSQKEIFDQYSKKVQLISESIAKKTSAGSNMLGWIDLIDNYDKIELKNMQNKAQEWIGAKIKNVLVIGIGGSFIGVKAAIDMCTPAFSKNLINFIYVNNISTNFITGLIKKISEQDFAIIVISKSGNTLEPFIGFRIFREILEKQYSKSECQKRIVAITDGDYGSLHDFAQQRGYTMFKIPNNIGGRYSTLTAVGIFPMLLAQINVVDVLKGAKEALKDCESGSLNKNSAYLYACYRHFLHTRKNYQIENFIVYDPNLIYIGEQFKQLFGESEGKAGKAMFPMVSFFTTDLHAIGQFLQEGSRNFIETSLLVKTYESNYKLNIKELCDLNYLDGLDLQKINVVAAKSTIQAHTIDGKVNNLIIEIEKMDAYHYGYIYMWLSKAAMMSGYLLGINPFDQPGVEAYKQRIKASL